MNVKFSDWIENFYLHQEKVSGNWEIELTQEEELQKIETYISQAAVDAKRKARAKRLRKMDDAQRKKFREEEKEKKAESRLAKKKVASKKVVTRSKWKPVAFDGLDFGWLNQTFILSHFYDLQVNQERKEKRGNRIRPSF